MEWLLIVALHSRLNTGTITMQELGSKRNCQVVALTIKEMNQFAKVRCIKVSQVKGAKTSF